MRGEKQKIDTVLSEIGIGKFQVINFSFVCYAVMLTSINCTTFIFTARDTSYRCLVPECDSVPAVFDQKWTSDAMRYNNDAPLKCERYAVNRSYTFQSTSLANYSEERCNRETFDNSTTVKCDKWVYGEGNTIVKGFNIPCEDWKRTLVGTINSAGQLVSLLFSGVLSDKYGRRNVMILMTTVTGVMGSIQSFAPNYWFFLVFEFLSLAASAGAYSSSYVYAMEILPSKYRDNGSGILNVAYVLSSLLLALIAWITPSWRYLLITANLPSVLMLLAYFMIPESVRWLNAKGRLKECSNILRRAAHMNNVKLGENFTMEIEKLEVFPMTALSSQITLNAAVKFDEPSKEASFMDILKAPQLFLRLVICAFCWFANVFLYFGLSINSVNISGNEKDVYLNFVLSTIVEFPSIFAYLMILRFVGRKFSMLSTLLLSGIACVVYAIVPNITGVAALLVYLTSKLFVSMSFSILYIYTNELFPTSLRNSTMNYCSLVGRMGGTLAPQVPLLHKIHSSLPMLTYGIVPIVSAVTLLKLPETKDKELPDTLDEAECLN